MNPLAPRLVTTTYASTDFQWSLDTSDLIQVGSFQRFQEADKMKARLELIGISADIQRVTISGTDVWFRVRVGPFKDLKKLQSTRSRLAENNI
ncbi:MAG: SPOR domain-containing protein, partial [Gammaproteobacteria bacterium]